MERIRKAILGDSTLSDEESSAPSIGKRLIAAVQKHAAGQFQNDDIAVVCYGRPSEPHALAVEGGRISTATGPMTQSIKRVAGLQD